MNSPQPSAHKERNDTASRIRKKLGKVSLRRLSVGILLALSISTILLLWLCVGLTFVSPDTFPRLSLLTLLFPVFLLADLLFILLWLLIRPRLAWIPLAGALLIAGYILDYCPLNVSGNSQAGEEDSTLCIVSFNVGYMTTDEQRDEFIRFINSSGADIVCLQELGKDFLAKHQDWIDTTAYHALQVNSVAVLSRLPFQSDTIHIDYPTRSNNSMACWIRCCGDSLLVVNNHLESNHLSIQERNEYTDAITEPNSEKIRNSSRMLVGKLSEAAAYRGRQADSICALVDRYAGHSLIVCGDFNDTPISYTYQQLARRLNSAYRQAGRGPGFTFSKRSFPVRIDHLFFSKDWKCYSCRIDRTVTSSDHYPLIVHLGKKVR